MINIETVFYGNSLQVYFIALGIFVVLVSVLRFIKFIVLRKLKTLAKKTKNKYDDVLVHSIDSIGWIFYIFVSLYVALTYLVFSAQITKIIHNTALVIFVFYIIKFIQSLISNSIKDVILVKSGADSSGVKFMGNLMIGVLWIIALLMVLANMGFDVTSLIAGLGIGGLAIGLALQNVLGDLFASLSIYLDKPFKSGDFIIVGEHMGTVKKIGIKTTRITSLWGEEIVISNSDLTSTRLKNYKKMKERRIHFQIGVVYDTPVAKMKKIPQMIKEIFKTIKDTKLDRVHFKNFGDFSLIFEIAYYVDQQDYAVYMDKQQKINLGIMERFQKEKIEFAYPTQSIIVEKAKK
jgi:small-conductance mechanosensitive channel